MLQKLLACALLATLTACASYSPDKLDIDRSIQATSQNSRVEYVVLHYTSAGNEASLKTLSERNVSSHYLVTDEPRPHVYLLVDESRRAWHAGVSAWYGRTDLNSASIGIEIVNPGYENNTWAPYNPTQMRTVAALLKDIIKRHQIKAFNVVGHSDIAPQRKIDPGPLFPWEALARQGIGRWYDPELARHHELEFSRTGLPDIAWIQRELQRVGYTVPASNKLDKATRNVIAAFQMHYRPESYTGQPDAQTLGILKALP
ncbi:N-acetylmuramoyl-L-alanine amidase [Pollutimonas thiosulfatoxidans]|uniref:N-acetylmuramoyl-L-alanine amidase n=1 Tax=Pollutimonas thiosulfatoxidans TaxID=2028345 RepID=A0A410G9B5_9BURK|nr:N-acetylmuramoyl-L-alanine amidase [Pollutimonas thiosulfatoxidans]QAA92805.1 N-acetylmuramoyl-L-alanine amidase [Pollutimonas thiosulfatoxidans]